MKKNILIYSILFFCTLTKAQTQIFIDQPSRGLPWRGCEVKEINSLNQFPNRIQFIVKQLIDSSMTDFANNVKFIEGQIVDLDDYFKRDSSFSEYEFIMPKYELYFELRDTTLSIKKYCLALALDEYGQIIRFDWPKKDYSKREEFAGGKELENVAVKYAKRKGYNTTKCLYELYYNKVNQSIEWEFSFLQKSTGNEIAHSEKYKSISIDIKSKKVTSEYEKISQGIACGGN